MLSTVNQQNKMMGVSEFLIFPTIKTTRVNLEIIIVWNDFVKMMDWTEANVTGNKNSEIYLAYLLSGMEGSEQSENIEFVSSHNWWSLLSKDSLSNSVSCCCWCSLLWLEKLSFDATEPGEASKE